MTALRVTPEEIAAAGARLSDELKQAMAAAVKILKRSIPRRRYRL